MRSGIVIPYVEMIQGGQSGTSLGALAVSVLLSAGCGDSAEDSGGTTSRGSEGEASTMGDGSGSQTGGGGDGLDSDHLPPVAGAYIWVYENDQGQPGSSVADRIRIAGVLRDGSPVESRLVARRASDTYLLRSSFPLRGRSAVFGSFGEGGTRAMTWFHHRADGTIDVDDELPKSWEGKDLRSTTAAGGQRHAFIVRDLDGKHSEAFVWDAPEGKRATTGPRKIMADEPEFELRSSVLSDDGRWLAVQAVQRASNAVEVWLIAADDTDGGSASKRLRVIEEDRIDEPDFGFAMNFVLDGQGLVAWSDTPKKPWHPNWIIDISVAESGEYEAHEINPPAGVGPDGPRCGVYPNIEGVFVCGPNEGFETLSAELIRLTPGEGLERTVVSSDIRHLQYPGPRLTSTRHTIALEGLPEVDDGASIRSAYIHLDADPPQLAWAELEGDEWYSPWSGHFAAPRGHWLAISGGRTRDTSSLVLADSRETAPFDRRPVYLQEPGTNEFLDHSPQWSPSGRYLFYQLRTGIEDPRHQLYMVDLEAGEQLKSVEVGPARQAPLREFYVCFDDLDESSFIVGARGLLDEEIFARAHSVSDPSSTLFDIELSDSVVGWSCLKSSTATPEGWPQPSQPLPVEE